MENDEEGCAPPTVDVADFEVAVCGDEIEVLCAAKGTLEEWQLQTTHLPHTPTR